MKVGQGVGKRQQGIGRAYGDVACCHIGTHTTGILDRHLGIRAHGQKGLGDQIADIRAVGVGIALGTDGTAFVARDARQAEGFTGCYLG